MTKIFNTREQAQEFLRRKGSEYFYSHCNDHDGTITIIGIDIYNVPFCSAKFWA